MPICPFIGLSVYRRRPVPICPFIGLSAQAGADLSVYRFIGLSAQAGKNRPCHHAECKNGLRLKKAGDCEYSHENGTPAPGNMLEVFFFGFCPFTPIQASC